MHGAYCWLVLPCKLLTNTYNCTHLEGGFLQSWWSCPWDAHGIEGHRTFSPWDADAPLAASSHGSPWGTRARICRTLPSWCCHEAHTRLDMILRTISDPLQWRQYYIHGHKNEMATSSNEYFTTIAPPPPTHTHSNHDYKILKTKQLNNRDATFFLVSLVLLAGVLAKISSK